MDQVEVHVVQLQALQGVLDGPEDIIVAVEVVPHLGADEDVGPLDGGVGLQEIVDSITNLVLVEVVPGAVQVTVSSVERNGDSIVSLALGALASEGTEANRGDGDSVAQCVGLSVRHVKSIVMCIEGKKRKRGKRIIMKVGELSGER